MVESRNKASDTDAFFSASASCRGKLLLQLLLLQGRLLLLGPQLALHGLQVLLQRLAFLLGEVLARQRGLQVCLGLLQGLFQLAAVGRHDPVDFLLGERLAGGSSGSGSGSGSLGGGFLGLGLRGFVLTLETSRPRTGQVQRR